jgi:hypothetical protein
VLALPNDRGSPRFSAITPTFRTIRIAEALGVRPGTVAASLNAAHAALRRELEEVRSD